MKHYVEIFFRDLREDAQKQMLELYNVNSPEEMNWDAFPIATICGPEEDE